MTETKPIIFFSLHAVWRKKKSETRREIEIENLELESLDAWKMMIIIGMSMTEPFISASSGRVVKSEIVASTRESKMFIVYNCLIVLFSSNIPHFTRHTWFLELANRRMCDKAIIIVTAAHLKQNNDNDDDKRIQMAEEEKTNEIAISIERMKSECAEQQRESMTQNTNHI